MDTLIEKYSEINDVLDMSDIIDDTDSDLSPTSSVQGSILAGQATKAGIQTQDLQAIINVWAEELNKSAIAESTGLPIKTNIAQYKGFAAEEYLKLTTKINALAKGVPSSNIEAYTKGMLPDGTKLSANDMHSDIVVFGRKWPWQNPTRIADAQVKMHKGPNASSAYAKDMAKEQYAQQEFIGGAGQGVNDKLHVRIGKTEVVSDSITPEAAEQLAKEMKEQAVPEYEHGAEKQAQLNRIHIRNAIAAGAITGATLSAIGEICYVIKNKDSLDEDQFIKSIHSILCGTVEGGMRGGAITGSVQAIGKALGKDIPTNSLGAVPIMAAANVSVDFAKDLYRCFVTKTIDIDDLLCNTVNNSFSSIAGFGGSWAGGQIAGQIISHGIEVAASAKAAAATGASIGSALGPFGTVVGAAVGGLLIGIGANAVISVGNNDAQKAFNDVVREIDTKIELEGWEKTYYFADTMSEISEFRLSFKDLFPCYNLISDLKEYNLHKKAIKLIHERMEGVFEQLEENKINALKQMESEHESKIKELESWFQDQCDIVRGGYRDTVETYIANSYIQYLEIYSVISKDVDALVSTLERDITVHSRLLDYSRNRNRMNYELNQELEEMIDSSETQPAIRKIVDEIIRFMQQDELIVSKQYLSFAEALYMVSGGELYG